MPHCEKFSSCTDFFIPDSNYISSKLSVMRGEEGVEDSTKEVIKVITSETCSISTHPNPRPQMAECDEIMLVGKFLLILNVGSKILFNGCRTDCLGHSDKSGAMCLREGHQKD